METFIGELDDFSKEVAELIGEARPAWVQFTRPVEGHEGRVLEVTLPNENPVGPLVISTDAYEITVFLGDYHRHFGYREQELIDTFNEAMQFVDNILLEKRVAVTIRYRGSARLGTDVASEDLKKILALPAGDHELIVRSWSGRLDAEISMDWGSYLECRFEEETHK